MSPETDRIQVPTNGKGPHPLPEPVSPGMPAVQDAEPLTASVAFTPTQLAVGFGILASLLVLAAGWLRRRGRAGSRGPFGLR